MTHDRPAEDGPATQTFAEMPPETRDALRARHEGARDAELAYLLEVCRSQGLDPWTGETFLIRDEDGTARVGIGRDGLLRLAGRLLDFTGFESRAVHAGDVLRVGEPDRDGATMRARAGVTFAADVGPDAGTLVGAWAIAERRSQPVRFFYAPLDEYLPANPQHWPPQREAMIEKCALIGALRPLVNLSGVYLADEFAGRKRSRDGAAEPREPERTETMGEVLDRLPLVDDGRESELRAALDVLEDRHPGEFSPAAIRMRLYGHAGAELDRRVDEIVDRASAEVAAEHAEVAR